MRYKITVYYINCNKTKDVYENVKDFWHNDNWFIIKFLNGESFYINRDLIASIAVTQISIFEQDKESEKRITCKDCKHCKECIMSEPDGIWKSCEDFEPRLESEENK